MAEVGIAGFEQNSDSSELSGVLFFIDFWGRLDR